jgi:hypothetical protein
VVEGVTCEAGIREDGDDDDGRGMDGNEKMEDDRVVDAELMGNVGRAGADVRRARGAVRV